VVCQIRSRLQKPLSEHTDLRALSVTDGDGAKIENLAQDQIHVGYQHAPEPSEDSLAVVGLSTHRANGRGNWLVLLHSESSAYGQMGTG
jgi:hypothetical protein